MGGVRKTGWTAVLVAAVLLFGAGCSKGNGNASAPTSAAGQAATTVVTTTAPAATSTPSTATTAGLSGTWSGDYQQTTPSASSGTFTIRWQQSGSSLTGTITIPGVCPPGCPITATLNGSTVSFGVVAGGAINYTGTVTGNSMAGTYAAADGSTKGTWKAARAG
jgi:hypothetical protein